MKIIIDTTKNIVPRIIIVAIFLIVLMGVIAYARGYRFNINERTITSTGILSVSSNPKPAKVLINGELAGVTDENLTLPYGTYSVEVTKEGYTSWKKDVSLKGEIVISLNAILFSKNPSLTPLTNLGVNAVIPMGNTDKLMLVSQTGDTEKDGIYLFEPSNRPAVIFPPLKLLLAAKMLPENVDMTTTTIDYDSNFRQGIFTFALSDGSTISYLVALDQENKELVDVTSSRDNIVTAWQEEKNNELHKIIQTLPPELAKIASDSFHIIALSPDEKKVMYVAKDNETLPPVIEPPLIGANQTPQERAIKTGNIYIYDKKEDTNFRIPVDLDITFTPSDGGADRDSILPFIVDDAVDKLVYDNIKWYPTSDYVAVKEKGKIVMIQYDGTNKEIVYAGPFDDSFFSISPDWNLIVVINLNPELNSYGDLYSVGIR